MNTSQKSIPQSTLEILAKSFVREMLNYGFGPLDYLRFVNLLLDLSFDTEQTDLKVGDMRIAA